MSRRVLMTGATGFVGRHVLAALIRRGATVDAILREGSARPPGVARTVEVADLFTATRAAWDEAFRSVDTVIHVAWYVEHGEYVRSTQNLACVAGTLRMAEAAAAAGVRRFVGIGTCFEYDLSAGYLRTDTPLLPHTPYGAAKAGTFLVLSRMLPSLGLGFAWCRLFYLHGEGEHPRRLVPYIRASLAAGQPAEITSGHHIRDYLDVAVAGDRIARAALSTIEGAINICSGVPLSVADVAMSIAAEYGRPDLLRFAAHPDRPGDPTFVVGAQSQIPD